MTGGERLVLTHADADTLASGVAARLLGALADAQAAGRIADVVLTGGGIGIAVLRRVASSSLRSTVDWRKVEVWWGDERWLPPGDPERNETQARKALLDVLDLDPARVHPMGADDGSRTVETAADDYGQELAGASSRFDVVLLGVGPDGHVASLFPGHPALGTTGRTTVAVHDSPKPPPTRISLTREAINGARQAWLLASGDGKADAVAAALNASTSPPLPAAGVAATERTLWLVDAAAMSRAPRAVDDQPS